MLSGPASCPTGHQRGGAVILCIAMLLLMAGATMAGAFQTLIASRHAISVGLDAELALRAAEAALHAAEQEAVAAYRAFSSDATPQPNDGRLFWPATGQCDRGAHQPLCAPAETRPPPWERWLDPASPVESAGVSIGTHPGIPVTALPAGVARSATGARYVIEQLAIPAGSDRSVNARSARAPRVRVTAVGVGRSAAVRVVVQSIFQL